jgi:transcriptional regulator with XRE-family HTH domain
MLTNVNQTFGRRMRKRRNELSMTLQELAEIIQASRSYLNQIELGKKNVTLDMTNKIAKALDVPVAELLIEK